MKIERQSRDLEKKELFKLANDNHLLMKNLPDDSIINVADYVRYTTDDGKEVAVFYHANTETGEVVTLATSSPTVIKTAESAFDFMESYNLQFKLTRSQSKAGRTYMNFELV
mgnify:CR=1 FL=1|jgi:hypothetical protein|nr:MAG TPA: hypothetical protein [Caudoviricetes sp.]